MPTIPRVVPRLDDEAFGLDRGERRLWVAQLWSGFSRGRAVFARSLNDQFTDQWPGTPGAMKSRFNEAAAMLLPTRVTLHQARDWLAGQGWPGERRCTECDHLLPLGALFCTHCGLPGGGHARLLRAACATGKACEHHPAPANR